MKSLITLILCLFIWSAHASQLPAIEDHQDIPEVFQREYLYSSLEKTRYIQTYGLHTCVALVVYSPEKRQGVLAHFDARTDLGSEVNELLEIFDTTVEITLVGGEYGRDGNLIDRMLSYFGSNDVEVIRPKNSNGMAITLDLSDGQIYEYDEMISNSGYNKLSAKNSRLRISGRKLYRHEQSLGGGDIIHVDDTQNEWDFLFQ